MPGILPMKVIKIGQNAQTRIAQACDRCRSKKIRCDGIRPCCSQCTNVGFECKTSDKLSRRAFPRGYTESLEERVRALEAEVRELKDLLDEKDEKLEMLSRIQSTSPTCRMSQRKKSLSTQPPSPETEASKQQEKDDTFKVVQSQSLVNDRNLDPHFIGSSNGQTLIDAFQARIHEVSQTEVDMNANAFLASDTQTSITIIQPQAVCWQAPARLVSDQLINIFFQEWAPLFPILHRPGFLGLYEEYMSCPEAVEDKTSLAQLNLVFAIAAQSASHSSNDDIESFNIQWQAALEQSLMNNSLVTLQCLLLAQVSCLQNGEHARLLKYKGLATSLSQRLGLHQSQKRFALGTLTCETRKKLFWTLYTLDCFSAAQLGLPRLLKDEDIHCEYPVDADDEYITETCFLPGLPGEYTKLSSALALFKLSQILARVLTENYPASATYDLSLRNIMSLSDELDGWLKKLPSHLRLQFVQDKPSTKVVSSRSPLLSLAYHYIRSLIYRPAVCASATIGDMAGSARVILANSSKAMVQIQELLDERGLAFSICLNKLELLVLAGFGLLFQNIELDEGGALMRENQRLINTITEFLDKTPSPASIEFRRISNALATPEMPRQRHTPTLSRHSSDGNIGNVHEGMSSAQKHIRAIMNRLTSPSRPSKDERRATLPTVAFNHDFSNSQNSLHSVRSEPHTARSEPTLSPNLDRKRSSLSPPKPSHSRPYDSTARPITNLDYLPLGETDAGNHPNLSTNTKRKQEASATDWEQLLGSIDNGQTNIYDSIYGGPPIDALLDVAPPPTAGNPNMVWSPEMWRIDPEDIDMQRRSGEAPRSVLSFSDDSLTSGEEFPELTGCVSHDSFSTICIPVVSPGATDRYAMGMGGLDAQFGL
ncbi:transcriptional activator protein-like protein acu-15 [Venturia nashicola]|uniref:Transcriptional activator protein-like protein acu-15 n=1 Tax=Venturia nashicola TaxID=86259 RepID=A0A4Z1NTQ6_9PEZI|nr:transcriptional activator protein-like protein acu-15 [Venturia nashicola]